MDSILASRLLRVVLRFLISALCCFLLVSLSSDLWLCSPLWFWRPYWCLMIVNWFTFLESWECSRCFEFQIIAFATGTCWFWLWPHRWHSSWQTGGFWYTGLIENGVDIIHFVIRWVFELIIMIFSLFLFFHCWNIGFEEEREGAPSQRSWAKTTRAGKILNSRTTLWNSHLQFLKNINFVEVASFKLLFY